MVKNQSLRCIRQDQAVEKKNKRAVVVQLMSVCASLWISCTTTKNGQTYSFLHRLNKTYGIRPWGSLFRGRRPQPPTSRDCGLWLDPETTGEFKVCTRAHGVSRGVKGYWDKNQLMQNSWQGYRMSYKISGLHLCLAYSYISVIFGHY